MRPLLAKIKPATGFSRVAHIGLNVLLPVVIFVLVRINFAQLALTIILLSKWRMFVVRPRFWPANIRANSVDLMFGLSTLLFMVRAGSPSLQLAWMLAYMVWLLVIKPATSPLFVSGQALLGLLFGLTALFVGWGDSALYVLVPAAGLICYLAARHFFDSFDEPYAKLLAHLWAFFGAGLVWVLCHWLLFYGFLAQPTLLLVAIGYGLAALYYLDHNDRLTTLVRSEIMITTGVIIIAVVVSLAANATSTVRALLR
ncbi:MAG TPA: hypothetical protein VLF91_06205 [Candidatus Saccharimonadales bacterium]|nr:hypothetical protein [Candidatus Saccharimonadales bacterium]